MVIAQNEICAMNDATTTIGKKTKDTDRKKENVDF
jgi:hypothetical protein